MSLLKDYSPSSASEITIILDDECAKNKAIETARLELTEDISHHHLTAATLVNPSTDDSTSSKNHQRNSWVIVSN
jgi:hypothetical protein